MPEKCWLKGIKFNESEESNAFGLTMQEDSSKPFLMLLQGLFLKHLLFSDRTVNNIET